MSRVHNPVHRYATYDSTARRSEADEDEFLRHMAASILLQAVEDWIGCIGMEEMRAKGEPEKRIHDYQQYKVGNSNFTEIRMFLRGDYGETLCGLLSLDPETVLEKMEDWLADYRESCVVPKDALPLRFLSGARKAT